MLRSHPKILEVAVVPVPDELRGEEVKAYIQPNAGESPATVPPEDIIALAGRNLAAYKIPRYIEYRLTDFERTPSMRVQKQALLKEQRRSPIAGSGTARPERSADQEEPCHGRQKKQQVPAGKAERRDLRPAGRQWPRLTMDGKRTVYPDGAVAINGTRIVAVGPTARSSGLASRPGGYRRGWRCRPSRIH